MYSASVTAQPRIQVVAILLVRLMSARCGSDNAYMLAYIIQPIPLDHRTNLVYFPLHASVEGPQSLLHNFETVAYRDFKLICIFIALLP